MLVGRRVFGNMEANGGLSVRARGCQVPKTEEGRRMVRE